MAANQLVKNIQISHFDYTEDGKIVELLAYFSEYPEKTSAYAASQEFFCLVILDY